MPLNSKIDALAVVGLISGKNRSFESSDRHRRGARFAKKCETKKNDANIDLIKKRDRSKVGRSEAKSAHTPRFSMCEQRHCLVRLPR